MNFNFDRLLQAELERLKVEKDATRLADSYIYPVSQKTIDLESPFTNGAKEEVLAEAHLLRQHKGRLEARMQILEDHNQQLEAQLQRLRQLLETDANGSPLKRGTPLTPSRQRSEINGNITDKNMLNSGK